ncbi:MAG: LuxR C-terminal-related transcriptional regulator [Caldilineaceae bacterium]
MSIPILQTKLYLPPPRPQLIARAHLIERLNAGLDRKLTLVAAQAGAGKTTLVSAWLAHLDRPAAWLALDEADSEPGRFGLYVIAALQTIDRALGRAAQSVLEASGAPAVDVLLTSLINDIATLTMPIILVLDDYHFINHALIHEALGFLVDHLPPQLHLVLLTREDPPLPLARWRVRQQLTELRAHDLRFNSAEAQLFLNETMGLGLQADAINTLIRRTEGWVAGLQLAALSLQNLTDTAGFIEHFAGDDRYLVDYLLAEVLERQPPVIQQFLLQTSILGRLSAPLCNAVTGRTDCLAILMKLEQANLFLVPLDNRREWYRYHQLFRDLLRLQLQEEYKTAEVNAYHQRAARWFTDQESIGEAVYHYLAAQDFVAAAQVIEKIGIHWIVRGHLRQVLAWLDHFPEDVLHSRPLLCVCKAWALNVSGQPTEVDQLLAIAQETLPTAPADQQREICGLINTVRAYLARNHGKMAESMVWLRRAVADLPESNLLVRCAVNLNLGFNYSIIGELTLADQALAAAIDESRQSEAIYIHLIALALRANVYVAQGKLQAAKRLCQETIDMGLAQNGGRPFPAAGYGYAWLGYVLYEQNDLVGAEKHLRQAIVCSELIGDWSMNRRGLLPLAWLKQMQGRPEEAQALWQQALTVVQKARDAYVEAQLRVHQARLSLAQVAMTPDDQASLAAANRWAATYRQQQAEPRNYTQAPAQMTLAWLEVLQGQVQDALSRLAAMADGAAAKGQNENLIRIQTLQALAHHAAGDTESALDSLHHALTRGAPQGYLRTFVDYGPAMQQLLQHAAAANMAPIYVGQLLAAFSPNAKITPPTPPQAPIPGPQSPQLVEPLNARETQILRLMAAGLMHQQIADELYLALNTVKWHARNLYGKLGVSRRGAAIQRARELNLL